VPVVALGGGEGGFHHRMRTVPNLFLCTGTLPGVCGLEGALASGRAVVKLVEDCFPAPAPSERFTEGGVRSVG
jgi:hypothetical protein